MRCLCRYGALCAFAFALLAVPAFGDPPATKEPVAAKKADKAGRKADKAAKKTDAKAKKAAEEAKKTEDAKKSAPATQKVKKGLVKITVELDGVLESENAQEIAVRPDEWSSLIVLHAAPHGAYVRKGDVVLELDPEKLDRAITDLRKDMQINALSLQQAEQQLSVLEKTTPMDMEATARATRQTVEDRDYYVNVDRPFTLKSTEFNLKSTKEYLGIRIGRVAAVGKNVQGRRHHRRDRGDRAEARPRRRRSRQVLAGIGPDQPRSRAEVRHSTPRRGGA